MPGYMAFTPIAALLLGAILILLLPRARTIRPREQGILAFLTASASFILSLSLWGEKPLSFTISHWRPLAQFGGELAYHIDDLALIFALSVTFTSAAAILTSLNSLIHEGSAYLYAAILTLLAASLSFFLSANLLTLYVSWGFLDLSILFLIGLHDGKEETVQDLTKALAASHLAGLALLIAALRLGQGVGQTASLPTSVAFPLLLAALLRLGLYPLHLWLPTNMERSSPAAALLHILPTSAGMYLLMRLCALSPQGLPQRDTLLLMGGLALVASALLLWRGEGSRGWSSYLLVNQVAYAVLVMALDTSLQGIKAALLQTLNLVFAWSILFLRGKSGWVGERIILGMAVASLLGLPLTLGFPARWLLYGLAFEGGHRPLIVAGAAANLITAAPLLDALFGDALSRTNTRASLMERFKSSGSLRESASGQGEGKRDEVGLIGLGLLAAPLLLFGLLPSALPIKLLGGGAWLPSVDGGRAAWILALLLLPPLGGYLLHRWGRALDRIGPMMKGLAQQTKTLSEKYESKHKQEECSTPNENSLQKIWEHGQTARMHYSASRRREFSLPSADGESFRFQLHVPKTQYSEAFHHLLGKLCAVISLEWLYRSLWWLSLKAGNVLQGAMGTIEGGRCLGWLLLSALVVVLLLLGD